MKRRALDMLALGACSLGLGIAIGLTKQTPTPQAEKPKPPVVAPAPAFTEARVLALIKFELKKREAKPLLPEVRGCQCQ